MDCVTSTINITVAEDVASELNVRLVCSSSGTQTWPGAHSVGTHTVPATPANLVPGETCVWQVVDAATGDVLCEKNVTVANDVTLPDDTATLIIPADGAILGRTNTAAFSYSGDSYRLVAGSTPGGSDYMDTGLVTDGSQSVALSGIPSDGSTVYLTLTSGTATDTATVTAHTEVSVPNPSISLITPNPGSTLSDNQTFTVNYSDAASWNIEIGTTSGGSDIASQTGLTGTSYTATIPQSGDTIYVTVTAVNGAYSDTDTATYIAPSVPAEPPAILTMWPQTRSTISYTQWIAPTFNAATTEWRVYVGDSVGGTNLDDSGWLPVSQDRHGATTANDGSTVYVTVVARNSAGDEVTEQAEYPTIDDTPNRQPAVTGIFPSTSTEILNSTIFTPSFNSDTTSWRIRAGTTSGGSDVFAEVIHPMSVTTQDISGFVEDGSTYYVTVTAVNDNGTDEEIYTYVSKDNTTTGPTNEIFVELAYGFDDARTYSDLPFQFDQVAGTGNITSWSTVFGRTFGGSELSDTLILDVAYLPTRTTFVKGLPLDGQAYTVTTTATFDDGTTATDTKVYRAANIPAARKAYVFTGLTNYVNGVAQQHPDTGWLDRDTKKIFTAYHASGNQTTIEIKLYAVNSDGRTLLTTSSSNTTTGDVRRFEIDKPADSVVNVTRYELDFDELNFRGDLLNRETVSITRRN